MNKPENHTIKYFTRSISTVVSVVLVWRSIWYALDAIDKYVFFGSHRWTAIFGFVIGLLLMWIPDHDLREIEKL